MYDEVAEMLAEEGFSDKEIATYMNVSKTTVTTWKKKYPEFLASLKKAKLTPDEKVKVSLFKRATGYSHPDIHIGSGGTITNIIKHHPPDVTACIFWLCNRQNDKWKRNQSITIESPAETAKEIRGMLAEMHGKKPNGKS